MKCERMENWILLKQSGELGVFRSMLLRRHLARCASCRAFEASSLHIQAAVPVEVPELSEFARRRILQAGEQALKKREPARQPAGITATLLRPAVAFALLLVVAGAGWLLLNRPDGAPQTAQKEEPPVDVEAYAWETELDEDLAELDEMLLMASQSLGNGDASETPADTEDIAEELLLLEESS